METGIAESFRNGTVLITGSTGFLGKILTEKLLRSCPVKNVAVLVRSKKGFSSDQRVADVYNQTIFDRLRKEKPEFTNNIKTINGSLEEPSLGLSSNDCEWLLENVEFVFHCAATIRFNETLQQATKINIQGTENLLALATRMKNLKGFVHVSTAYSHCPRSEIREEYYPVPITAKELSNLFKLDKPTPEILNLKKDWPNTYTFTKAVTENLISTNENQLPISIFRPSIIGCTDTEPIPGWLENMNGSIGVVTGVIVGFIRTVPIFTDKITDIIPVDYTANALISVMWDTVNRYRQSNLTNKSPKIYNYVSSVQSPLHWSRYIDEVYEIYYQAPPLRSIWYIFCVFSSNIWVVSILRFLLHRIPAAFMDLSLIISGKKPKMLKMYQKTESLSDLLYTFTSREWKFDNSNTQELWSSLSQEDRKTFWFSFEEFDWKSYVKCTVHGIKKHILHEDPSSTTRALERNRKLYWLHQLCIVLMIYIAFQICWLLARHFVV